LRAEREQLAEAVVHSVEMRLARAYLPLTDAAALVKLLDEAARFVAEATAA